MWIIMVESFFPFRDPIPMIAQAFSKPFGASFGNPHISTWDNINPPPFPTYPLSADDRGPRYGLLSSERQVQLHKLMDKFTHSVVPPSNEVSKIQAAGFSLLNYIDLKVTGSAGMVLPWKIPQQGSNQPAQSNGYGVDHENILSLPARIMEEIAISPDEYDEKNYTILTNYMLSAYIRLKESGVGFSDNYIPPDIGHYDGEKFLEIIINGGALNNGSITNLGQEYLEHLTTDLEGGSPPKKQHLTVGSSSLPFFLNYIERQINWVHKENLEEKHISKLKDIDHTLTSWVPHMAGDHFTDPAPFRKIGSPRRNCSSIDPPVQCCFLRITDGFKMNGLKIKPQGKYYHLYWEEDKHKHIPHFTHCVSGGRSGFSVKIIHPSTVSSDLLSSEKGRHNF